jgi:2-keto-3-deoxy-L-rhamnonate aldolase RhmA
MIETVEAIRNLDEILKVQGVDLLFIGPGDLSQSMGYLSSVPLGEKWPQPVRDAVASAAAKIQWSVGCGRVCSSSTFARIHSFEQASEECAVWLSPSRPNWVNRVEKGRRKR